MIWLWLLVGSWATVIVERIRTLTTGWLRDRREYWREIRLTTVRMDARLAKPLALVPRPFRYIGSHRHGKRYVTQRIGRMTDAQVLAAFHRIVAHNWPHHAHLHGDGGGR